MKKNKKLAIIKFILITFGSFIYSLGIAVFLDPNSLAPGGTTGIAIIISKLTSLQTGTLTLLINIILSTIYVTFVSSFFINNISANIIGTYGMVTEDLLLSGATGGALMGIGMAIVFRQGATTGGTDIIVRALRQKYRHIKSGNIFILTDAIIITASAVIFKNIEIALYAAITVVISNYVLDAVLYGGDSAKLLYIVSDNYNAIAKRILEEIDIGVTYLKAEGAYTSNDKKVIMCVCRKYNYTKIRQLVTEEDTDAFFIVSNASEVFGDGYKSYLVDEI